MLNTTDIVMAEIAGGTGITLRQAAAMLPPTRRRARTKGESARAWQKTAPRPVHPSAVFRWCTEGSVVAGGERVRLEAARCAGKILTTQAALQRFVAAQSGTPAAAADIRTPTRRRREHAQASAALADRYGI